MNEKVKSVFKYVGQSFKGVNRGPKFGVWHYVSLLLLLVTFTMPFIAGSFTKEAKQEELANYISERVKDSTTSGTMLAVGVAATDESGGLPFDVDEFLGLYGVFKQQNATFLTGFNIHKEVDVHFVDIFPDKNLSIIYTGVDGSVEYNGHYKHWYYPYEFMFKTERMYDISKYMIYISQSQADALLGFRGVKNANEMHTLDDYQQLIKTTFDIDVGGNTQKCVIANIYYESNYYYRDTRYLVDDFVICAYYCPGELIKEHVYFFREYTYQNSFFMNHINGVYSNKKYDIKMVKNNIKRNVDETYVTSFYYDDYNVNSRLMYIFIIIPLVLIALLSLICIMWCNKRNLKYLILVVVSTLTPYFVFFICHKISGSTTFFSDYGIRFYVYLIVYLIIFIFVVSLINIFRNRFDKKNGKFDFKN